MRRIILRNALRGVVLLIFAVNLTFILFSLIPGPQTYQYAQPILCYHGCQLGPLSPRISELMSPVARYYSHVLMMLSLNFGLSPKTGVSVGYEVVETGRLSNTLLLAGISSLLALAIAVPLGVLSGRRDKTIIGRAILTSSLFGYSIPIFMTGLFLIASFATGGTGRFILSVLTATIFLAGALIPFVHHAIRELPKTTEPYRIGPAGLRNKNTGQMTRAIVRTLADKGPLIYGILITATILVEWLFTSSGLLVLYMFDSLVRKDYRVVEAVFYLTCLGAIIVNVGGRVLGEFLDRQSEAISTLEDQFSKSL